MITEVTYERLFPDPDEKFANDRLGATATVEGIGDEAVQAAYGEASAAVYTAYMQIRAAREEARAAQRRQHLIDQLIRVAPNGIHRLQRDYALPHLQPTAEGAAFLAELVRAEEPADVYAACAGKSEALLELALRVARQRVAGPDLEF